MIFVAADVLLAAQQRRPLQQTVATARHSFDIALLGELR